MGRDVLATVRVPGEKRGAGISGHRPQRQAVVKPDGLFVAASSRDTPPVGARYYKCSWWAHNVSSGGSDGPR